MNVSVVIPVFNAERYLNRCVKSFLAQTMDDFELILVDDGSTDKSGTICDEYSMHYENVRVVHQMNQGVGSARQVGLNMVRSKYVIFADPDDWVENSMLDELFNAAEDNEADVVICDFIINASEKIEYYKLQTPRDLNSDSLIRQLVVGELHGSTCNKLYRSSSLRQYDITFPPNINYCEDLWFNCKLCLNKDIKIAYTNKAYYHYDFYSNSSGLSRKFSPKSVKDYMSFTEFVFKELGGSKYSDEFAQLRFNTIKLAFRSDCQSSLFYSIFPEHFDEFKKNLSTLQIHWAMKYGLLLALNGNLKCGRFLLKVYEQGYLPIAHFLKSNH